MPDKRASYFISTGLNPSRTKKLEAEPPRPVASKKFTCPAPNRQTNFPLSDGLRALGQTPDLGRGRRARLSIDFEHHVEARHRPRLVRLHHALDDARDVREAYAPFEEGLDRHLVRGVQSRRERAARAQGPIGQAQTRETLEVGRLEVERAELRQIERRERGRLVSLRVSERVLNGVAHVRDAELSDTGAV